MLAWSKHLQVQTVSSSSLSFPQHGMFTSHGPADAFYPREQSSAASFQGQSFFFLVSECPVLLSVMKTNGQINTWLTPGSLRGKRWWDCLPTNFTQLERELSVCRDKSLDLTILVSWTYIVCCCDVLWSSQIYFSQMNKFWRNTSHCAPCAAVLCYVLPD